MNFPAGTPPPAPHRLDEAGVVHAIDGDQTALCEGSLGVEQVDLAQWTDVPAGQQCRLCQVVMGAAAKSA